MPKVIIRVSNKYDLVDPSDIHFIAIGTLKGYLISSRLEKWRK